MIVKVFNNDESKPQRYSFKESEVTIGRNPSSECSVVVNSHTISRNHLKVRLSGQGIQLQDLNSSNGTFLNKTQVDPHKWQAVVSQDKITLAQFEGESTLNPARQSVIKAKKQVSSSSSDSERSRSRDKPAQLPFKISESTFRMLKDMTINRKSKEQRIKFLKLMGISKAPEYWQEIEKILKQKKGMKDKQQTNDNLERQFSQSRSGMEKKGLGK